MVLFALLLGLVILVLVVLGFVTGAGMVLLAPVLVVAAVGSWRRGRRGLSLLLVGGAFVLVPGLVILDLSWRLAAWYFPPILAEHRRFEAEQLEKPTLGPASDDVERFVKAEAAYHAANGSHFDKPECLVRPQDCIPGYTGPPFLDAKGAGLGTHGGFTWTFHPGAPPAGLEGKTQISRSSIETYALVGVPVGASAPSTAHSVCGDFKGVCIFQGSDHGKAACVGRCLYGSALGDDTPPVIVAFDPPKAHPGERIRVTAAARGQRIENWRIGGVPVQYGGGPVGWDDYRLELVVPKGAVSGKISVTTPHGTATSASDFVVLNYTGLRVAPASVRLVTGEEQDLTVTASVSDGTTVTLNDGLSYESTAYAVANVDSHGHLSAGRPGTARITARLEGFSAVATVTVAPKGRAAR